MSWKSRVRRKHWWLSPAKALALVWCTFASTSLVHGATLRVRQDGTGNFTTIQACVNAMTGGDTCLVGPGTYAERVTFPAGKSGNASQLTTVKAETAATVNMRGFDTANCNYLRIEGFNIGVTSALAGVALRSSHLQIVSNYLHDIPYIALYGFGGCNSNYVAGNRLYAVAMGIVVNGTGWLVQANEIERLIFSAQIGDADYCRFFGLHHVLRQNYWHGTLQSEIGPAHVDGFQTYDDNGEIAKHIRIEGNRVEGFFHQGVQMSSYYQSNTFDILICNNIIRGAESCGVIADNVAEIQIFNNLFLDTYAFAFFNGGTGQVRNNIFYNATSWDSSTPSSFGSKNIWYLPGGTVGSRFPGDLLNANPLFVDAANSNFHLRPGSPAIDAGVALASVNLDRDGLPRPQGAGWDIGPYEYVPANPAARLLSPAKRGTNFVFTLTGGVGLNYRIEASTNLLQWSQVKTVTLASGSAQLTNPALAPRRFFRSTWLP